MARTTTKTTKTTNATADAIRARGVTIDSAVILNEAKTIERLIGLLVSVPDAETVSALAYHLTMLGRRVDTLTESLDTAHAIIAG